VPIGTPVTGFWGANRNSAPIETMDFEVVIETTVSGVPIDTLQQHRIFFGIC
jgi:hypothetical protein